MNKIISSIIILVIKALIFGLFLFSNISCQTENSEESFFVNYCENETIAFHLNIDFSAAFDHINTSNTSHIQIYFEDYFENGFLAEHEKFELSPTTLLDEKICLPISEFPLDTIIIGLRLLQNNREQDSDLTLFIPVPYSIDKENIVEKTVYPSDLWNKPPCVSMPFVIKNIENYKEGKQNYSTSVAGSYGIGDFLITNQDLSQIKKRAQEDYIGWTTTNWCPCSKIYIEIFEN